MTASAAYAELLTPRGQGGIGVIALTGDAAPALLAPLFTNPHGRSLAAANDGDLLYGTLQRDGDLLDEVVICRRAADRYEINCHGGAVPLRRVMGALEALGVTMRGGAFDPLPAPADTAVTREAAALLPGASTAVAAMMLLDQWHGALGCALRDAIDAAPNQAAPRLRALADTAVLGIGLCSPRRLVVAGAPNVGKSTLVNRLLAEERMIVHDRPGTTRDVVEQLVAIRGYPLVLADTAGIGALDGPVDAVSVERSLRELRDDDLVLLVRDATGRGAPEPKALEALRHRANVLAVLNKIDAAPKVRAEGIRISALTGEGFDGLEEALLDAAYPVRWTPRAPVVFTPRQRALIGRAIDEPARHAAHLRDCLGGKGAADG